MYDIYVRIVFFCILDQVCLYEIFCMFFQFYCYFCFCLMDIFLLVYCCFFFLWLNVLRWVFFQVFCIMLCILFGQFYYLLFVLKYILDFCGYLVFENEFLFGQYFGDYLFFFFGVVEILFVCYSEWNLQLFWYFVCEFFVLSVKGGS